MPTPNGILPTSIRRPHWVEWVLSKLQILPPHYRPRIYTDGSFTTRYGSLGELMHLEPGNIEVYASVIIMDASPDWRRLPVIGLRITGKEITANNAYIKEMLKLAAGYHLIEYEVSREGVQTDCNSARQVVNDGHTRLRQGNCAQRILLQSILRAACTPELLPVWVESHARRRKKCRNK